MRLFDTIRKAGEKKPYIFAVILIGIEIVIRLLEKI